MIEHTTKYTYTLETATELANAWTKCRDSSGVEFKKWRREYNTAIRVVPQDSRYPDMCWAVTNRFDPRVAKGE